MNAAVYARKSTDQNDVPDEAKSITRQVEHAKAYAERKGWTVVEDYIFIDDGISGAEFERRPGFLRLMKALKPTPPFQVLIMSEESRLGREAIETSYALKQLDQAGVRVFLYLSDTERTLDSPEKKAMLALKTMADEMERDNARQRTHDALARKARAGHVTGGACFGYRNVEVFGPDGRRSHVTHEITPTHAAVIRRIFELCAEGCGQKAIAKRLNAEGAASPRAQQGRVRGWSPSSIHEVLYRERYRGVIVWNQTRKRDRWGQARRVKRPREEWEWRDAPHLRIVDNALWEAAHTRLGAARRVYLKGTGGERFGRPPLGSPSKYLLTSLAECGQCGSSLIVRTSKNGLSRSKSYGCSAYHHKGKAICPNGAVIPMEDADGIVVESLLDEVLTPDVLDEAIEQALQTLLGDEQQSDVERGRLEKQIRRLEGERKRLAEAVAKGGEMDSLLDALSDRESRLARLRGDSEALRTMRQSARGIDSQRVVEELRELAINWREVLVGEPVHARPILSKLLVGRVIFTPLEGKKRWELRGRGTIAGLFRENLSLGMVSPTGFEPVS